MKRLGGGIQGEGGMLGGFRRVHRGYEGGSFLLIFFRAAKSKWALPELANTFSL